MIKAEIRVKLLLNPVAFALKLSILGILTNSGVVIIVDDGFNIFAAVNSS